MKSPKFNCCKKDEFLKMKHSMENKVLNDLKSKYYTLLNEGNLNIQNFRILVSKNIDKSYDFQYNNQFNYRKFFIIIEKIFLDELNNLTKTNKNLQKRDIMKSEEIINVKSLKYNDINQQCLDEYNKSTKTYDPEFYTRTKNNNVRNYLKTIIDNKCISKNTSMNNDFEIDFSNKSENNQVKINFFNFENKIFSNEDIKFYKKVTELLKENTADLYPNFCVKNNNVISSLSNIYSKYYKLKNFSQFIKRILTY